MVMMIMIQVVAEAETGAEIANEIMLRFLILVLSLMVIIIMMVTTTE
jgi:hypothetical protein